MILSLFLNFLKVGLFSIGGGYAALPLLQSTLVTERGWLTIQEFSDLISIAEMTPGPMAINAATFVGIRLAGIPGALAATGGCMFPSLIFASLLAKLYFRYRRMTFLQNVLSSLRPAVTALIAAAGLSILRSVLFTGAPSLTGVQWLGAVLFVCALFALRKWRPSPILIMLLCGGLSLCAGICGLI